MAVGRKFLRSIEYGEVILFKFVGPGDSYSTIYFKGYSKEIARCVKVLYACHFLCTWLTRITPFPKRDVLKTTK